MSKIKFQVDPRIALLLSEGYRSTEVALKELVDNAWDADAKHVNITLPRPLSKDPIVVEDDGSGMTEIEIKKEYLVIASNRRSRRGEITAKKKRKVKGRKGIGKFAGLMASSTMHLETISRGECCSFTLNSSDLKEYKDLHGMPIELKIEPSTSKPQGTKITLTEMVQGLKFPNPDRFRQILMYEYGRESDFKITVDGKPLGIDDIQGDYTELNDNVENVGDINLRFTISDNKKKHRQAGIVVKVEGKAIGEPTFFGLDEDEDVPKKLLHKLYGEVEASGLLDHVTSDWGALVENSELYESLKNHIKPILKARYKVSYGNEINLAQARIQKKYYEQLSALPEHKRAYAEKALYKIIQKYFQEPDSKIDPIVSVVLDAFEKTDYQQATEYRNDFSLHTEKNIKVLLIGGKRGSNLSSIGKREKDVKILVFNEIISTARRSLAWMLKELRNKT